MHRKNSKIPVEYISNLCDSIPRRLQLVVAKRGYPTKIRIFFLRNDMFCMFFWIRFVIFLIWFHFNKISYGVAFFFHTTLLPTTKRIINLLSLRCQSAGASRDPGQDVEGFRPQCLSGHEWAGRPGEADQDPGSFHRHPREVPSPGRGIRQEEVGKKCRHCWRCKERWRMLRDM